MQAFLKFFSTSTLTQKDRLVKLPNDLYLLRLISLWVYNKTVIFRITLFSNSI